MATFALDTPAIGRNQLRVWIAQHPLRAYFILAFAPVWLATLPFVLAQNGLGVLHMTLSDVAFILLFIGGTLLGPTGAAFVVTAAAEGRSGVRALLRRYVQWRVGIGWYALVLLGYIGLNLIAAGIWQGTAPLVSLLHNWPLLFSSYLPGLIGMIIFPALLEEPGWRGFALPRLQSRYGALRGSLLLGFLHGIWHLPVYTLVIGPAAMGPFNVSTLVLNTISIMALTIVWTWVFNHARGSILIAILLHAASNATNNFFPEVVPELPPQFGPTLFVLFVASAVVLVVATRGRLGYNAATAHRGESSWNIHDE